MSRPQFASTADFPALWMVADGQVASQKRRRLGRKTQERTVDIATRPPPYFEEQRQRLCGLHALNHAVGFRAFAEADMEAAVEIILNEASAAAHAAGVASE